MDRGLRLLLEEYNHFGTIERTAGAFRNILEYQGFNAPHTGEPFTESLLMGIGGGLGAEYATWAFQGLDPTRPRKAKLYLRFHHVKNYVEKNEAGFLQKIATRLGVKLNWFQTSSPTKAYQNLLNALNDGVPPMTSVCVWQSVNIQREVKELYEREPKFFDPLLYGEHVLFLPYYTLPYFWFGGSVVVVYGLDEVKDQVYIADASSKPFVITLDQLNKARGMRKSQKHALAVLESPSKKPNLIKAIRSGIHDCVHSLLFEKRVVSGAHLRVQAWGTIAKNIANPKVKQGWAQLFDDSDRFFDTLTRLHAQVTFHNSEGAALRSLYGEFLNEASTILGKPKLKHVANQFREVGRQWSELGKATLPDSIPLFHNARKAALGWNNLFRTKGPSALQDLKEKAKKIQSIRQQVSEAFPLRKSEKMAFLEDLSRRFQAIYEAENNALQSLKHLIP